MLQQIKSSWEMKVKKQVKANKQGRLTRFETLGGYWRGYCLAEAGQRARENTGRADTANHTPACFRLANDGRAALKTGLHAQRGECSPQIGDNVEQCAHTHLVLTNSCAHHHHHQTNKKKKKMFPLPTKSPTS